MPFEITQKSLNQIIQNFKNNLKDHPLNAYISLSVDFHDKDSTEVPENVDSLDIAALEAFVNNIGKNINAYNDNIDVIRNKIGFDERGNGWIKEKSDDRLNRKEAEKFLYQRLLLLNSEEESVYNSGHHFNEYLSRSENETQIMFHSISDDEYPHAQVGIEPEIVEDSEGEDHFKEKEVEYKYNILDLILVAKFHQLKEDEKIPADYAYQDFVGLVRNSIKVAENSKPKAKVTTESILGDLNKQIEDLDEGVLLMINNFSIDDFKNCLKEDSEFEAASYKRRLVLYLIDRLKEKKILGADFDWQHDKNWFVDVLKKITKVEDGAENGPETITFEDIEKGVEEKYKELDDKSQNSALTIQKTYRGYLGRKQAQALKIRQSKPTPDPKDPDPKDPDPDRKNPNPVPVPVPVIKNSPVDSQEMVERLLEVMKGILEEVQKGNTSSSGKMDYIRNQIIEILREAKGANLAQNKLQEESLQKIAEMMGQVKKLAEAKPGKKDDAESEWQTSDENGRTKNVTYKYLLDTNYVSNGENHYLIPEIKGRGDKSITQYENGLTVFNYKDLNEFSQDADIAGKGWDKNDNRLLSSIVCIGEGENQRHCVVTSSARGVTKNFISHAEFREIIEGGNKFFDQGLEAAIKTSALDETLEVLNSAKKRYENKVSPDKNKIIEIIDNEIAAIEVRKAFMDKLTTRHHDNLTIDDRLIFLNLYNNLDIALPRGINFDANEEKKFDAAKSRTVVIDDSFNQALEVVLKMDAAKEIIFHLEEEKNAIIKKGNEFLEKKLKEISSEDPSEREKEEKLIKMKSELNTALQAEKLKKLDDAIECLKINDNATFEDKKKWSPKPKLNDYLDDLLNHLPEGNKIKELADSLTKKNEDPQDIAKKLTSATSDQINLAQDLAEKELGMKKRTDSRKEKLENATDKEKESARHSASCNHSHQMAKSVEKSIENEMINGLDSSEVKIIAEDMAKAHAKKGFFYGGEDEEAYKKDVRKLLKAPVPHSHVNGVGFHRPRGTSIVSVAFNYSGVENNNELPGNTEAYVHIDGSNHCYIGCRVCKKDGLPMTVYKNGQGVTNEDNKRGDTAIDQNTISFFDPKTQDYTHVEASPSALKAHLELMKKKGNPYPGSVETIMAQYQKMQIKVTSQVNNANRGEEPDIERKVSIMHKGKTLSYNADKPETTIGKKKVVTKAIGFNEKGEVINIRPGFDSKVVLDEQEQFVKINEKPIDLYVKLSTNKFGEVTHGSEPYVKLEDETGKITFETLILNDFKDHLKSIDYDEDDIEDEAEKLFSRAKNECKNTKLIVPLGEGGKEYKISISDDFTGVGSIDEKPSNSVCPDSATKLGNLPEKKVFIVR